VNEDPCTTILFRDALHSTKVDVSLANKMAEITFDEKLVSVERMKGALRSAGYGTEKAPEANAPRGCCS